MEVTEVNNGRREEEREKEHNKEVGRMHMSAVPERVYREAS